MFDFRYAHFNSKILEDFKKFYDWMKLFYLRLEIVHLLI